MVLDQISYTLRNYDWDSIILGGLAFTIWNIDIMKSNYFHLRLYFFQHYDLRFKVTIGLFWKLWLMLKINGGWLFPLAN
jgi:hypothetical protein